MDAARREVIAAAERVYDAYIEQGLRQSIPFLGFGIQYIRFAREEPELYRLLFLSRGREACSALEAIGPSQEVVVPALQAIYHLNAEDARRYFRDLWLVAHSLATLIVTGGCTYTDQEISDMLTGISISICKAIKEVPGFVDGSFEKDAVFRKLIAE